MNYSIIKDEGKFREFIQWLPDLQINERFYLACFARKKYCAEVKYIKTDKAQVKRVLVTKENIFNKVRQMECPLDSYEIKGVTIPQEALALYISVNPRDLLQGAKQSLIKLAQLITQEYNGYNPHSEVMSEIHKAKSRKIYFDLDIDDHDPEEVHELIKRQNMINLDCLTFLKTKNGCHCLIKLDQIDHEYDKTWYRAISTIEGIDVRGDVLLPVAGCTQGNFVPHFVKF